MRAILILSLFVLLAGCTDGPTMADEGDAVTDAPESGSALDGPVTLLDEPFQVAPSQSAAFTVTVPEGAEALAVRVQVDQSVYMEHHWLTGLGDCDDLQMGSGGATVNLGENNGSGGSDCSAPAPGDVDITFGIDEGVSTGVLTITAS